MTDSSALRDTNEDLSLLDIVDFLRDGWRTILTAVLVGGGIGLGVAFTVPEKYESRAIVQPGRALGSEVEPVKVLAEKMRTPSYYSAATLTACEADRFVDPAGELARGLNPRVARESNFVSIAVRASSTQVTEECLKRVLADVVRNQAPLSKQLIEKVEADVAVARLRLQRAQARNAQELLQNESRLATSREKLTATQKFIADYEAGVVASGGQRESQPDTSSVLLSTIITKQAEQGELQILVNELEVKVKSGITGKEDELQAIERQIAELQRSLSSPATEAARFATPVYSPTTRVEPKRSLTVAIALIAGAMLGLALMIGRRLAAHVRAQDRARKAAQAS
jgi:uncharacterized protein involved in exopolysaccharide biosynthesis